MERKVWVLMTSSIHAMFMGMKKGAFCSQCNLDDAIKFHDKKSCEGFRVALKARYNDFKVFDDYKPQEITL